MLTSIHKALANINHPMFMIKAGAAKNMKVTLIGKTVIMKVIKKMTAINITNFTTVAVLFCLKVSAILICSMHYPSTVCILRPVSY